MLSDEDRTVLEIAGMRFRQRGMLCKTVRERLGWSDTRFYQRLNALTRDPDAEREFPTLIKRTRRQTEQALEWMKGGHFLDGERVG